MALTPTTIDNLPNEHPVALYAAYHEARKENDGVILKSGFDPIEVPRVMPWLLILDRIVKDRRTEFFYRFAGTGCNRIFGIDYTGMILGEKLPPEAARARRREIMEVIDSKAASVTRTRVPLEGREFQDIVRGVFPASHTGEHVDRLHIVIAPENMREVL